MEAPRFPSKGEAEAATVAEAVPARAAALRRPWLTGRFLVELRPAAVTAGMAAAAAEGLRVASTRDSGRGALSSAELEDADVLVMPTLGFALLSGAGEAPERMAMAARSAAISAIRPERAFLPSASATAAGEVLAPLSPAGIEPWPLGRVGVLDSAFTGRGVAVAFLDTGIDRDHPDFAGGFLDERSIAIAHGFQTAEDGEGHGTAVAGIVAGPAVPASGARYGIAPDCVIHVAKVLDDDRNGAEGDVLHGIEWAVGQSCRVALLAFADSVAVDERFSPSFEEAAARAVANGCLLIAPVGNDSRRNVRPAQPVSAPANCPSVLAISAVDQALAMYRFSNGAHTFPGAGEVDATSPGVDIRTSERGGGYGIREGTSHAAAHAAGLAALWAEAVPLADAPALRQALLSSSEVLQHARADVGVGLLSAP